MEEINKEKLKALQVTLDRLDKSYGKGSSRIIIDEYLFLGVGLSFILINFLITND